MSGTIQQLARAASSTVVIAMMNVQRRAVARNDRGLAEENQMPSLLKRKRQQRQQGFQPARPAGRG